MEEKWLQREQVALKFRGYREKEDRGKNLKMLEAAREK